MPPSEDLARPSRRELLSTATGAVATCAHATRIVQKVRRANRRSTSPSGPPPSTPSSPVFLRSAGATPTARAAGVWSAPSMRSRTRGATWARSAAQANDGSVTVGGRAALSCLVRSFGPRVADRHANFLAPTSTDDRSSRRIASRDSLRHRVTQRDGAAGSLAAATAALDAFAPGRFRARAAPVRPECPRSDFETGSAARRGSRVPIGRLGSKRCRRKNDRSVSPVEHRSPGGRRCRQMTARILEKARVGARERADEDESPRWQNRRSGSRNDGPSRGARSAPDARACEETTAREPSGS